MAEPAADSPGSASSSWWDLAKRHEGRVALALLLLITIPMLTKIFTSDFGTHLALGRYIVREHAFPTREVWNYPSLGMENASGGEWGFQAILWLVYSAGGVYGVSALIWAVVLGIFLLLHRAMVLRGANPLLAVLAIVAFSGFLRIRIQPRPEIFTYLFIALTIWLLTEYYFGKRKNGIYLFPGIVLLWANCHPTFLMAFILWGAFFVDALGRAAWNRTLRLEELKKWAVAPMIAAAAGLLVCGLNPYGYVRLLEPLHLISRGAGTGQDQVLLSISELTPVKGTGLFWYYKAAAVVGVGSFLLGVLGRRVYLLDLFLFLIAFKGAWSSARAVSMMGLFLSPGVSLHLTGVVDRIGASLSRSAPAPAKPRKGGKKKQAKKGKEADPGETAVPLQGRGWRRWGTPAVVGGLVASLLGFGATTLYFSFSQLEYGVGITEHKFSFQAVEFLRKNPVPGKMFNFFDVGGFLDWQLFPQALTFIDGRTYNQNVFMEHQAVTGAMPGWEDILRRHGVTYVVTKALDSSGMILPVINSLGRDPGWSLVFADGLFVIFVRKTPETMEYIRTHEIPKSALYQQIAWEAYHYIYLGVSPVLAYQTMSRMYEMMGNRQAAIDAIRKGLEYGEEPYLRARLMQLEQGVPAR